MIRRDGECKYGQGEVREMEMAVGRNFMARDIKFENSAGPNKHQTVASHFDSNHFVFHGYEFYGYHCHCKEKAKLPLRGESMSRRGRGRGIGLCGANEKTICIKARMEGQAISIEAKSKRRDKLSMLKSERRDILFVLKPDQRGTSCQH